MNEEQVMKYFEINNVTKSKRRFGIALELWHDYCYYPVGRNVGNL